MECGKKKEELKGKSSSPALHRNLSTPNSGTHFKRFTSKKPKSLFPASSTTASNCSLSSQKTNLLLLPA